MVDSLNLCTSNKELANAVSAHRYCTTLLHRRSADVHRALSKHAVTPFLAEHCNTGVFFDKSAWKRIVKNSVLYEEEIAWTERLKSCRDFERFHKVPTSLTTANVQETWNSLNDEVPG